GFTRPPSLCLTVTHSETHTYRYTIMHIRSHTHTHIHTQMCLPLIHSSFHPSLSLSHFLFQCFVCFSSVCISLSRSISLCPDLVTISQQNCAVRVTNTHTHTHTHTHKHTNTHTHTHKHTHTH